MRPGRKRSEEAHAAILGAALTLVRDRGLPGASVEAIARHAGVGKQTIYRWWSSRGAVVLEALREHAEHVAPVRTSRTARGAFRRFLRDAIEGLERDGTGRVVRALMAEAQLDDAFRQSFREAFIEARQAALGSIFERAIADGELPRSTKVELLVDITFGALWYRLLVEHRPLDDRFVRDLVALVFD